jgi:multidrug resistance efflux pump
LADLKKMEQGNRPEEIQQAEARMKAASATHQRWELEYERTKRLLADGASTKAEFEATDAAHRRWASRPTRPRAPGAGTAAT